MVTDEQYRPAAHLLYLNQKLKDISAGRINRLLITMPPQHGKSELTSRFFPVWFLGEHPTKRVVLASYNGEFAAEWGSKARAVVEEYGPELLGLQMSQRSSANSRWDLRGKTLDGRIAGGGMKTVGKGGSVTGRTAHLFIFDDPFAGPGDAESVAERNKAWNWYLAVARTRLRPDGAVIIIQTRWHEDDIAGRIKNRVESGETDEHWEVVDFPALAEGMRPGETDELGRRNGDALWPDVYGADWLKTQKKELTTQGMGTYYWSALYQQKPIPLGGGIFKREWERLYWKTEIAGEVYFVLAQPDGMPRRVPMRSCTIFSTVDLAASDTEGSAWTVVSTWALSPRQDLILLDVERLHAEGPEQFTAMQRAYDKWSPSFIGIEDVAYQLTAVQTMKRRGVPVRRLSPEGRNKIARALVASARMEGGNAYFPTRPQPMWMLDVERELYGFPKFPTKDFVDTFAYAAREAARLERTTTQAPVGFSGGGNFKGLS